MVLVATPLGGTTDEDVVCDNIGKNNKAMYDESSGASQVALVGTPRSRIAVGDGERTCDSTAFTSYPGPCSTICDKDLGGCLQAGGGDMELRWPFLMYDIPTIVVPDIERLHQNGVDSGSSGRRNKIKKKFFGLRMSPASVPSGTSAPFDGIKVDFRSLGSIESRELRCSQSPKGDVLVR